MYFSTYGNSPEAAMNAFKLTMAQPNGDIISTDRGYYVIQLSGIPPPQRAADRRALDVNLAAEQELADWTRAASSFPRRLDATADMLYAHLNSGKFEEALASFDGVARECVNESIVASGASLVDQSAIDPGQEGTAGGRPEGAGRLVESEPR